MNKIIISIAAIIVIIIGIIIYIDSYKNPAIAPVNERPAPLNISSPQPSNGNTVINRSITIQNFAFSPASLEIEKNAKIIWTNQDSTAHSVKLPQTQSQILSPGDSFSFTFTQTGTFDYLCGIHPSMKGRIIVK